MANPEVDKCFNALMDAADALESVAGKVAEAACQLHKLFDWDNQVPDGEPMAEATLEVPEPAPVSFEQLRAVLADKAREGFTAEIRALLTSHGAPKLSEIDPAHYPPLLAAVESLGAAS